MLLCECWMEWLVWRGGCSKENMFDDDDHDRKNQQILTAIQYFFASVSKLFCVPRAKRICSIKTFHAFSALISFLFFPVFEEITQCAHTLFGVAWDEHELLHAIICNLSSFFFLPIAARCFRDFLLRSTKLLLSLIWVGLYLNMLKFFFFMTEKYVEQQKREKKIKYWVSVHAANRNSPVLNTVCKRAKKIARFRIWLLFLSKNDGDNVPMLHCRKVPSEKLSIGTHWEICSLLHTPKKIGQFSFGIFEARYNFRRNSYLFFSSTYLQTDDDSCHSSISQSFSVIILCEICIVYSAWNNIIGP